MPSRLAWRAIRSRTDTEAGRSRNQRPPDRQAVASRDERRNLDQGWIRAFGKLDPGWVDVAHDRVDDHRPEHALLQPAVVVEPDVEPERRPIDRHVLDHGRRRDPCIQHAQSPRPGDRSRPGWARRPIARRSIGRWPPGRASASRPYPARRSGHRPGWAGRADLARARRSRSEGPDRCPLASG